MTLSAIGCDITESTNPAVLASHGAADSADPAESLIDPRNPAPEVEPPPPITPPIPSPPPKPPPEPPRVAAPTPTPAPVTTAQPPHQPPPKPTTPPPASATVKPEPPPRPSRPAPASPLKQIAFAGPLPWKSWVRTAIFGRYRPLGSIFKGKRRTRRGSIYYHQGVDILAPVGTRLVAPADGVIARAGAWNRRGYGKAVLIRVSHGGKDLYVLYAHLDRILVRAGQNVKRGQVVGRAGKSGNAGRMPKKEEHVHVEVRTRESTGRGLSGRVDPLKYFTNVVAPKELRR